MWWYNILGDNEGSISHLLQHDPITAGSILLNVKLVTMKRENREPILTVKLNEWRKFVDYFGLSIEADPSRVSKRKYIFPCWIYTKTFICKLHISRHYLDKYFTLQPQHSCLYQPTKTIAARIDPHISSALIDLQLGKNLLLFS